MSETNVRKSGSITPRRVSIKIAPSKSKVKVKQSRQPTRSDRRSTAMSNFRLASYMSSYSRVQIPQYPKPRNSTQDNDDDSDHEFELLSEYGNPMKYVDRRLSNFVHRDERDSVYIPTVPLCQARRMRRSVGDDIDFELKEPHDADDVPSRQPSYRKFRMPLEVLATQRFITQQRKYEEQFQNEIQQLINYQATALDASNFVRIMAYTTFWPPLHNERELEYTTKHFFRLTAKERTRLKFIMNNEFH